MYRDNVVPIRPSIWWLWADHWDRSYPFGGTEYENTPEFRLHMALYVELGGRAYEALVPLAQEECAE